MAQAKLFQSIVGGYQNSNIDRVCKSTSVNMYMESQGKEASSPAILRSIYGTSVALELPEGKCRGMYRVSRGHTGGPVLYGVWGSHCYVIYEGVHGLEYREVGRVSNAYSEPVSMTETNGYGDAHPHLIVADGAQVFAVDVTLLPTLQAADWKSIKLPYTEASTTEFIKPSHVAYAYGYLAVLDAGTDAFVLSCQYPFEDDRWGDDIFMTEDHEIPAEGSIPAYTLQGLPQGFRVYSEWCADSCRALISAGSYIYTFGDRSFQVFSYHDDVKFPFQSPDTAANAVGIKAYRSVVAIGQNVFWLGSSDIGEGGVYMATGASAQRVSTPDIEREILAMKNPKDAIAQTWQENHHLFYAITFRTDNRTLVYDVMEKTWAVRASYDSKMPQQEGLWRPQYAIFAYDKYFFGLLDDNKLIYLDKDKWTEYDGLQIVRRRRSGVMLMDYSPFYCNDLKLICNNGDVPVPDLNPKITLRWSWDGSTWSDQEVGLIGTQGRYDWISEWWTLGYGSMLTVEITCSDPMNFCILNAKIQVEQAAMI